MTLESGKAAAAMLEQGYDHLREGLFDNAVEAFTACLAVSNREAAAFRGRGLAGFQIGQWAAAASDFKRALELDPSDKESRLGLGMSQAMQEQIYEALATFEGLMETYPDFVRGHIQLGLLHYKLCATAKGKQHMELALSHRPTLAERRTVERILREQKALDEKRFQRPDFEALRRARRSAGPAAGRKWADWLKKLLGRS